MKKQICETCGEKLHRHDKYDAYACLKCDVWTEGKCSDAECQFCSSDRPEKPSEEMSPWSSGVRP